MSKNIPRILVLGASGMLGASLFRAFNRDKELVTFGSVRNAESVSYFDQDERRYLIPNISMEGELSLLTALSIAKPDIVINCIGIIKQLPDANNHLESLAINATLPHRLVNYCNAIDARLIHFSTDCVYSGKQGQYKEEDTPDAYDLYGRTKLLGEVCYPNSITLRTSIIGHEMGRAKSLVDWFLSQSGEVKGFNQAIFSGLPTIEVARVVKDLVIPNRDLCGLYHLSVDPINKFELLKIVAETYGKDIRIIPDEQLIIDRSLNSDRFRAVTGFKPRPWVDLIKDMHQEYLSTH